MDFFTRLAERTLAQTPVAQPLIAPRFAAGPAIAAEAASGAAPGVEAEAGGLELSRGPSTFPLDSATRPPLATAVTPQQAAPASSELPDSVERPFADGGEQPSLLPSALRPEVAAHGRAKPKPVQASGDRLVQGEGDSQVSGQAGGIILRPAQPDGPLAGEHRPGVPPRPIGREQQLGSRPALERLRQTPEETTESRGAVRTLLPEQSAPGGSEESPTSLDVRPNVTAGSTPVGSISEGRGVVRPEASPQPPTIRVTIGRVEVQAVMPPAPAPITPIRHDGLVNTLCFKASHWTRKSATGLTAMTRPAAPARASAIGRARS